MTLTSILLLSLCRIINALYFIVFSTYQNSPESRRDTNHQYCRPEHSEENRAEVNFRVKFLTFLHYCLMGEISNRDKLINTSGMMYGVAFHFS